ncbi:MAG: hypothetical protein MPK62_10605, partial [Alphaproteobacteria bacterium]|nr:hypothetical protein [Alphaproteobacteria bacterium]
MCIRDRYDTFEVIEGNSRLAAFRHLYQDKQEEKWSKIPCNCVDTLTPKQQYAYLGEVHLIGKTEWNKYEKANICYVQHEEEGVEAEEIAKMLSLSPQEVRTRIAIVEAMKKNRDKEKEHFSYYEVLERTRKLKHMSPDVKRFVLKKIKETKQDKQDKFTALELRDKLPDVLEKPKEKKKFVAGKVTLDEAYQNARPSHPRQKIKAAMGKLESIENAEVLRLDASEVNALFVDAKRLVKSAERIRNMVEKAKEKNA